MSVSRRLSLRFVVGALLATLLVIGAGPASAQRTTLTTTEFLNKPSQLLELFPNGGPQLASLVQQFAIEDSATVPLLIGLLANASPEQKTGIANGLAQAAKIIVLTDQARAADIQQRIAAINDRAVNIAFGNALGDVKLGAIGGGALGGAGAGLGGQTDALGRNGGNTGGPQQIGGSGTSTPSFSMTSSVGGTSGVAPVSSSSLP